jgi:hypothetical protein
MKFGTRHSLIVIVCILLWGNIAETNDIPSETTLKGKAVQITVDKKFGGAVTKLIWNNKQFINAHDKGRLIQVAWATDDYGEALNPTEGGSIADGENSSTEVMSTEVKANTLQTTSHPAYWHPPGFTAQGGSTALSAVSADKLQKTITVDYLGNPNLIRYEASITLAKSASSMIIETPAIYANGEFNVFYSFNPKDGSLIRVNPLGGNMGGSYGQDFYSIILATQDGKYAITAYASGPDRLTNMFDFTGNEGPENATAKVSRNVVLKNFSAGTYSFETYIIVGTLEEVYNELSKLSKTVN